MLLIILLLQLMFGNAFIIRTLAIFRERAILSANVVTKTGTVALIACQISAFLFSHRTNICILVLLSEVFALWMVLFVSERRQIDALTVQVPMFLDRWILNLKLGHGLIRARDSALNAHCEPFQLLMRPLLTAQTQFDSGKKYLLLSSLAAIEVQRLSQQPHSALARLENLRENIRKASDFRRKSGQATRQTTIQAAVMCLLLIVLICFTLTQYGWRKSADLVVGSLLLTAIGVWLMQRLARKTKWKL